MDRRDRETERKTEERIKNGKYCQIYHIIPSHIILVICNNALLYTNIHLASNALTLLSRFKNY